jgi:hypothetical protein
MKRRPATLVLISLALLLNSLGPNPAHGAPAHQIGLPRTSSIVLRFVDNDLYPGRLTNFGIALRQLQTFFNKVSWEKGATYSFLNDVLTIDLKPPAPYVDTPNGFGYGINGAAVLMNKMILNTAFWDIDGIEKPVFLRVQYEALRLDRTYDVYGVNLRRPATDYTWRLNPAYDGTPPRIAIGFDEAGARASMTVDYDDEATPPSRKLSLAEKGQILAANLKEIVGDRNLGVSVVPVASPADTVDVNADLQIPVASAWKGGAVVYFFENIDRSIWTSLPIQYWNIRNINRVPREYQDAFAKYNEILRYVYIAGVFSGNHEAGNVINYVWKNSKWRTAPNAIVAFNDWSYQEVGISSNSGLHRWLAGMTENPSIVDHRLDDRQFIVNGRRLAFDNTYSPHDLALFYYHVATVGKRMGYYNSVNELLSTKTDILSMLKGFSAETGILAASKIGYFAPDSPDAYGHDVNTDAGLLTLPNGEQYAVATMAFDTVPLQADVLTTVMRALLNVYQSPS